MKRLKSFLNKIIEILREGYREKYTELEIIHQYFPLIKRVKSVELLYGIVRLKVKFKSEKCQCLICGKPLNEHKYIWVICWESEPSELFYVCLVCYETIHNSREFSNGFYQGYTEKLPIEIHNQSMN